MSLRARFERHTHGRTEVSAWERFKYSLVERCSPFFLGLRRATLEGDAERLRRAGSLAVGYGA